MEQIKLQIEIAQSEAHNLKALIEVEQCQFTKAHLLKMQAEVLLKCARLFEQNGVVVGEYKSGDL